MQRFFRDLAWKSIGDFDSELYWIVSNPIIPPILEQQGFREHDMAPGMGGSDLLPFLAAWAYLTIQRSSDFVGTIIE